MEHRISRQITAAGQSYRGRLGQYLARSAYERMHELPGVIDLAFGDPHEYPSRPLVELLQRHLTPQHPRWFAYTRDHPPAQAAVAHCLSEDLGIPFEPDDVALTNGAFAGLMTCLRSVCDPGDEVIYLNPAWFYYEPMIVSVGAEPRRVDLAPGTWRLDPARIAAAITPATSAVIVNSPNNPTGAVYSAAELSALADVLTAASRRHGRPIYLISDEAYRRIVFDGLPCPSPGVWYPYTLLVHTYTKTLLLPGERVGYIALPPTMPGRPEMRDAISVARLMTGWAFPNNPLLFAVPELEAHGVQVKPLQQRRDILAEALDSVGYRVVPSQGTFYLLAQAPTPDDWAHARRLEEHRLLALPGSVMGAPGCLRLSLTITDAMLDETVERLRAAYSDTGSRADVAG
jgi:aspartate aminotransferase